MLGTKARAETGSLLGLCSKQTQPSAYHPTISLMASHPQRIHGSLQPSLHSRPSSLCIATKVSKKADITASARNVIDCGYEATRSVSVSHVRVTALDQFRRPSANLPCELYNVRQNPHPMFQLHKSSAHTVSLSLHNKLQHRAISAQ